MEDLLFEDYTDELWVQFKDKIKNEWSEKYQHFGNPDIILNGSASINFAKAIQNDMIVFYKKQSLNIIPLNPQTLYNYFQANALPKKVKTGTLDTISRYIGYQRWSDFQTQQKQRFSKRPPPPQSNPIHSDAWPTVDRKNSIITILSILLFIFMGLFLLDCYQDSQNEIITDTEKSAIRSLIKSATNLEFNLYRSIPELKDTQFLDRFFMPQGKAKQKIIDVLKTRKNQATHLKKTASNYKVKHEGIDFIHKKANRFKIGTIEFWKLVWVDINDNVVITYEEVNRQTYILKKINNSFKIEENIYFGSPMWVQ